MSLARLLMGPSTTVDLIWFHGPPDQRNVNVSVIKINAITVPADSGDELAERFAARAGAVDGTEGFEGFELLKPTDDRNTWLVVTRWRDEGSFEAWVSSPAFAHGHRSEAEQSSGANPGGHPGGSEGAAEGAQRPVGMSAELWSYEVAGGSEPTG